MRYPTNMTIAGMDVPVTVQDTPVYLVYKCPTCKDPDDGMALVMYLKPTEEVRCPCCKCTNLQFTGNSVYGCYSIVDNNIRICATNEQVGGMNLVHETLEGINDLCDLQLNHTQISTLGAMMYKAFASGKVDFTPQQEYANAA